MKINRKLILVLSLVLSLALATGSTLAYLSDTDADVNTMTLGNVDIEQHEYERIENADGTYETIVTDRGEGYKVQEFTQNKPLYPAVGEITGWDSTVINWEQVDDQASGGQAPLAGLRNVVDKFVLVENTGKSPAYIRSYVALEVGSGSSDLIGVTYSQFWQSRNVGEVEINGNNYYVIELVYNGSSVRHVDGVVPAGDYTYSSLGQIYLASEADNDDVAAIDGNDNGTYDVFVLSQAIQVNGFEDKGAAAALNEGFGEGTAENVKAWFEGENLSFPEVFEWEGVSYITTGDTVTVTSNGGDTLYRGIISDGKTTATTVNIREGIKRLNNRSVCKAPTITTVTLPNSLTYIDESTFQQSAITSIEVPENVTYIGKTAFGACADLETIIIRAKDVTMANYVARDCANLKSVYIYSDSVTFESGSMYFTNAQTGNASGITFYVSSQAVADALYNAATASQGYGLLIKSIDGSTTYYNTLK